MDFYSHYNNTSYHEWSEVWSECLQFLFKMKEEISQGRWPLPLEFPLPDIFGEAWLNLMASVTALVANKFRAAEDHLLACRDCLLEGRKEMMRSLTSEPLHDKEAVLPLGILSKMIQNLLSERVHTSGSRNVGAIYLEYFHQLVCHLAAYFQRVVNNRQSIGTPSLPESKQPCTRRQNTRISRRNRVHYESSERASRLSYRSNVASGSKQLGFI